MTLLTRTDPIRHHLLREAARRREHVRACVDAWRTTADEQQQRIAYGNVNIALEAYAMTLDALGGQWRRVEVTRAE